MDYLNKYGKNAIQSSGCHLVAQAKLLAEAGAVDANTFNPDAYFDWLMKNGYLFGKQSDGSYAVGERNIGSGMIAYAKTKGVNIKKDFVSLEGKKAAEKIELIQSYIEKGYFIILDCFNHETYVMRTKSLQKGTPWISDSSSNYSSVSTKSGIYAYTGVYGGGGAWEAAFTQAYLYSISKTPVSKNEIASTDDEKELPKTVVCINTTASDSITKTSAILRGSFTVSGARATECGMYFGMSESNMSILGADKVNTNCTGMYYSTAKYGKTLNPGTTYYYQAYVKVGKTTYKGDVKKFTTNPSESFSITLDRSRLTLPYDTCGYLTASTTPAKLSVTWKSSDSSVVTVKNGVVSTVGTGTADIIAEVACNGETATAICSVTVTSGVVSVTTKGVDSITQTSAIIRGNVSVSGGKATECGMYLGTSSNNLSFLGSDSINSSDMPFYYSTSKYGRTLTPNTDYYYRAYAVVNGTTYWGEIKSFTTTKKNDPPTVSVTTKGADAVTRSSAIVRGNVSVSDGKASECGMYFGHSESDLSYLGSDNINSSDMSFYYSTSKYGRTLTASTTYYYQAYAVVNGTTYWGKIKSFTTEIDNPLSISVTTKGADSITQTSAIVRGNVSVSDGKATECGMYLGTSSSNLSFLGSDSINSSDMPFYYSTSKYGRTLTAGTTYYYQAYAVVNGTTYWGKIKSFTTEIDNPLSISVTTKGADSITQTSAIVRGNVSVSGGKATECGMYLGTSSSNLSFLGSDSINSSDMPFYYSTSKYGRTLMPGTTYYYRAYAVVDGATYWGDPNAFTTEASSPVSNMRTAIVVNTNGSYLAINDRAAASPKYSNQIGRIPPAGVVTVYPDKTNGNWYYVEYNGVSGYAYGKYLSLQ